VVQRFFCKLLLAQRGENKMIGDAVELLKTNGFDELTEAVTVSLNSAMVAERSEYLGAAPYERSAQRTGYANCYNDKALKTRPGTLALNAPQSGGGESYPQSLERGLRSERDLLLAISEMYVQGVSTRRVKKIVEELCGTDISSTQVSRTAAELDELLEAWHSGSWVAIRISWLMRATRKSARAARCRTRRSRSRAALMVKAIGTLWVARCPCRERRCTGGRSSQASKTAAYTASS